MILLAKFTCALQSGARYNRASTVRNIHQHSEVQIGVQQVEFLGHLITPEGLRPLPAKVQTITDYPRPTSVRHLRRFLGLANFHRRFIPHAAAVLQSLHNLLSTHAKAATSVPWPPEHERSFVSILRKIAKAALLAHPIEAAETCLIVDASDVAIGAVLEQRTEGNWMLLAFFSQFLTPTEQRYSTFGRELLAGHAAAKHFCYFLEDCVFHIKTDDKSLVAAVSASRSTLSDRAQRQLAFLAELTTDFRHVSGEDNRVADSLSRVTLRGHETPFPAMTARAGTTGRS